MVTQAVHRARFLAPGDKLGKHDLVRQIAVGGMAELYLARTVGLEGFEKLVVLKRILPQFADNASFVNMFLNEARLAATLHHPNIAQVFDIGQDGTDYFFSMEYVHGQDLGNLVASATDSGVPISLDAALTLVAGLCAGLHYAHEKSGPDGKHLNVVHRDVSPSNVLVSYDGAVKLVDFGIARAGSNPATTRGGLKGKIAYMSPEQCRGKVTLDRRSDVFSIGTILYELTTGRLPFTDETEYGILNQIVNRDAEPASQVVPGYSPDLDAIVMRALARDPDRRYATALELQKDIEDYAHENRLRVSPLVLARLMGTLFPTRLEEWDHARAQGAFFVEQHVVRTLIESGLGDGSDRTEAPSPSFVEEAEAGTNDTIVGPPPVLDQGHGPGARPLPGMPPSHGGQPAQRPSQNAIPQRTSQPALGQPPQRPSSQGLARAPTPTPAAHAPPSLEQLAHSHDPEPLPRSPRMPTPVPPTRLPTPVPGIPGAVPIVMGPNGPMMAGVGTLVTSQSASGSNPGLVYPTMGAVDVTERVRAQAHPHAAEMRGETALVKIRRSRAPLIILAVTGTLAAAVAAIIVFSGGKKEVAAPPDPAVEAKTVQPDPAQPDIPDPAQPDVADPARPEVPDPARPEVPDPAKPAQPDLAQPDPAKPDPDVRTVESPKPPKKPPAKIVRQVPKAPRTPRVVTAPKKDPPKKIEPKADPPDPKETKWTPDSPFMPVRPPEKK